MKTRYIIPALLLLTGLLLGGTACQREEDIPDPLPEQTLRLDFRGEIVPFDDVTKAPESLGFSGGDVIYVRLENGVRTVLGKAIFNGDTGLWSFTYNGSLEGWGEISARCWYIPEYYSLNNATLAIQENTPVYFDESSVFTFNGNSCSLTAHLSPATARLRFVNPSSFNVDRVEGLSRYTAFDLVNYEFTAAPVTLTSFSIDEGNYFYGFFTDPTHPSMTITDDGWIFTRDFASDMLRPGRTGYLSVPSFNYHENWVCTNEPETIPYSVNGVSFNMVNVPGGPYLMSSVVQDRNLTLTGFQMSQTEVTQELWEAVMGTNPSHHALGGNYPVERVGYYDCLRFIEKLNALTGKNFRLPTEAEWEYAAMNAVSESHYFSGSDNIDLVGWYDGNSGGESHPVAQLNPNSLGLYDMSGNVAEWVSDWCDYNSNVSAADSKDPRGSPAGYLRIRRGGAYTVSSGACSNRYRWTSYQAGIYDEVGFRLVLGGGISDPVPEFVDLGLSVPWATFNVGAWAPYAIGDFFAWGETRPKGYFDWNNYAHMLDGYSDWSAISKYTLNDGYTGTAWYNFGDMDQFCGDNINTLEPEDDAASSLWGDKWRTPTQAEWQELLDNCEFIETTEHLVSGYKVKGPNGNSIFLPFAGYQYGDASYDFPNVGRYLSSSLRSGETLATRYFEYAFLGRTSYFDPAIYLANCERGTYGYSVRPVYGDGANHTLTVPSSLKMGCVSDSRSKTVKVRNTGALPVTFKVEGYAECFSFSPEGDINLSAGQAAEITFTFEPEDHQEYFGTFQIVSDQLESPLPIDITGRGIAPNRPRIVMDRIFQLHYANNYFAPKVTFFFDNGRTLTTSYFHTEYYDNAYRDLLDGVYFYSSNDAIFEDRIEAWNPCIWEQDTWITERITIYPDGNVGYQYNSDQSFHPEEMTYVFPMLDIGDASSFTLQITPEGWWTGHEHWMDFFKITTYYTDYADDFESGVFDDSFWETPANPDGVRVERGCMKLSQLRTDQDFRLNSKTIYF